MMQLVPWNFLCVSWIHDKIDAQQSDRFILFRKALRTERPPPNSREEEVLRETVGAHLQSWEQGAERSSYSRTQ